VLQTLADGTGIGQCINVTKRQTLPLNRRTLLRGVALAALNIDSLTTMPFWWGRFPNPSLTSEVSELLGSLRVLTIN